MHSDFAAFCLVKVRKGLIETYQRQRSSEPMVQSQAPHLIPRLAAECEAAQCALSGIVFESSNKKTSTSCVEWESGGNRQFWCCQIVRLLGLFGLMFCSVQGQSLRLSISSEITKSAWLHAWRSHISDKSEHVLSNYFVPGIILHTPHVLLPLTLTTILWGRCFHSLHFMKEEKEAGVVGELAQGHG